MSSIKKKRFLWKCSVFPNFVRYTKTEKLISSLQLLNIRVSQSVADTAVIIFQRSRFNSRNLKQSEQFFCVKPRYSHFDGLVPVDDVTAQRECVDVDHVDIPTLRAHVNPLRLERQVKTGDSGDNIEDRVNITCFGEFNQTLCMLYWYNNMVFGLFVLTFVRHCLRRYSISNVGRTCCSHVKNGLSSG